MCELFQRLHVYGRWTWGPVCLNEGWPQSTNTWLIQLRPHSKCVPLDGILRISRRRTREIFALCLPFSHHISLSLSLFSSRHPRPLHHKPHPKPLLGLQYRIGQLYMISKHSCEQSGGGEGVEVVRNEPDNHPKYGAGQLTEKRIYLSRYN